MAIPDEIHANIIDLMTDLMRAEVGVRQDVLKMLEKLGNELVKEVFTAGLDTRRTDWQKARLRELINQVQDLTKTAFQEIGSDAEQKLHTMVEVTSDGVASAVNEAVGAPLVQSMNWTPALLKKLASDTLVQGAPAEEWWSRQAVSMAQGFADQMRQGIARGESLGQLTARVRPIVEVSRREAIALVRTTAMATVNAAAQETYKSNDAIIQGLTWCATLDPRTCVSCAALDFKQWLFSEDHPDPPLHWNCRCCMLPWLKAWADLAREHGGDVEIAKKLDKIKPGQRAAMDGPVAGDTDYDTWFRSLTKERQLEILGPGRYQMWKDNKLSFSDMVDKSGNPMTLADLRAKY